jgi:hypothetical protein
MTIRKHYSALPINIILGVWDFLAEG